MCDLSEDRKRPSCSQAIKVRAHGILMSSLKDDMGKVKIFDLVKQGFVRLGRMR